MTARRAADRRTRDLEQAERLVVRLHVEATVQGNLAKKAANQADELSWWRVRQAAAEAVDELRRARRAPGIGDVKPAPPDVPRDHLGVPEKA